MSNVAKLNTNILHIDKKISNIASALVFYFNTFIWTCLFVNIHNSDNIIGHKTIITCSYKGLIGMSRHCILVRNKCDAIATNKY